MNYQSIIGLETHVELKTKTKMFCTCRNDPDEHHPNILICPTCLGHPGTLPVINKEAVRKTIKTGLALNCQIPEYSKFDRKNYFYPDLPKGYQISQLYQPLCKEGFLEIDGKKIRIREVHLEEDTGRLSHHYVMVAGTGHFYLNDKPKEEEVIEKPPDNEEYSLIDFNRAGIPLMELVTEPDLKSAKEARRFAEELQLILRYLGVSDADMEKGQLRVEVNISLSKTKKLGTKVEIKNLNSFRAIEKGIDYEIKRQTEILKSGKKVTQETRGWSEMKGMTIGQREKEEAHDYRYFPEPDLPLLHSKEEFINKIKAEIPELPRQKRERFKREYELEEKNTEVFVQNKDLGEYFEKVVSEFGPRLSKEKLFKLIKLATNYLITDLQGLLKGALVIGENFLITPENFAEFVSLIADDKISSKVAKQVLEEMLQKGKGPSQIVEESGLLQISDTAKIEKVIQEAINDPKNQKAIQDFKSGKEGAIQFIVGQIMAKTKGKANPQMVIEALIGELTNK